MEQSKLSTAFFKTMLEGKDMDQLYNNLQEIEEINSSVGLKNILMFY